MQMTKNSFANFDLQDSGKIKIRLEDIQAIREINGGGMSRIYTTNHDFDIQDSFEDLERLLEQYEREINKNDIPY